MSVTLWKVMTGPKGDKGGGGKLVEGHLSLREALALRDKTKAALTAEEMAWVANDHDPA